MIGLPWTFKEWILRFRGVDLPIGDFADDVARDPDFPDGNYYGDIVAHLTNKQISPQVLETFSEAWVFYKATTYDPTHDQKP